MGIDRQRATSPTTRVVLYVCDHQKPLVTFDLEGSSLAGSRDGGTFWVDRILTGSSPSEQSAGHLLIKWLAS